MKKFVSTAVMAVFLCPSFALGQGVCDTRENIIQRLEDGYQEKRAGVGLAGNGTLVELFISKDKGTWTFMYTRPDGVSCLMAAGGDWEDVSDPAKLNEVDS